MPREAISATAVEMEMEGEWGRRERQDSHCSTDSDSLGLEGLEPLHLDDLISQRKTYTMYVQCKRRPTEHSQSCRFNIAGTVKLNALRLSATIFLMSLLFF